MSKIGFINDVVRGIKKIVSVPPVTPVVAPNQSYIYEPVITSGNVTTDPLLKRTFMFLEEGLWGTADEYCEKILDMDPECAEAYLGKLMVEMQVKTRDDLKFCKEPLEENANYKKFRRFCDTQQSDFMDNILAQIEGIRIEEAYQKAADIMKVARFEESYLAAIELLETLGDYKNSAELIEVCKHEIEHAKVEEQLRREEQKRRREAALKKEYDENVKALETADEVWVLNKLLSQFISYGQLFESPQMAVICKEKIQELETKIKERHRNFENWVRQGKCSYCGGDFTGLIVKTCKSCGRSKRY